MHAEFSYDLSIAPKLQRVGSIHIPGWDQPTPDPSFSAVIKSITIKRFQVQVLWVWTARVMHFGLS